MANGFLSFLKKFGQDMLKVITFGAIAARDAAPMISAFNPALGSLLTGSATAILAAETAGASAAANAPSTDTGAQKAALAIAAITPLAERFASEVGISSPTTAQITAFNNALVAALNAFGVNPPTTQTPAS